MFKSRRLFPFLLFSFIFVSAVFSLSLSHLSQKRVTLKQKAVEEQQQLPVSEWAPIDLALFNQEIDKETTELTKELNQLPSQKLSAKDKTKRQDVLQRSLQIKQITKEEHNLMDENKDGKISYEEFNKRDVILAEKVYQLRHTTLSTLNDGLYDERMVRITTDNLNQYSSPTNNVLRVIVEAGIYQDILQSLQQYRLDVIRDWNYNVQFYLCNNCQKETTNPGPIGIKNLLRAQGTIGTVFVGDLPAAWFRSDGDVYPVDYYFMDLDGLWSGETECSDGNYESICFTNRGGNIKPEIFFGRLTVPVENDEVRLLNNYFRKNHHFRRNRDLFPRNSLAYIDDDFVPYFGSYNQYLDKTLKMVYPNSDLITDFETTNANDYKNRLANPYEHLYLAAHSSYTHHWFATSTGGGNVYASEIRDLKPHYFFYNLYACSNARFTEENYLAGWYVFQESDYGLLAIASVKAGAMLGIEYFYNHLSQGANFGTAFYQWFSSSDHAKFIDITMIGDPTLTLKFVPSSRLLHYVDQPIQNHSYSSPFEFAGWTIWENGQRVEKVEFYMDLPREQVGRYGEALTDQFERPDLCRLNPLYCKAGWKWRFNPAWVNNGPHKVYVYAYDANKGYVGGPVTRNFVVVVPPSPTIRPTNIPGPTPEPCTDRNAWDKNKCRRCNVLTAARLFWSPDCTDFGTWGNPTPTPNDPGASVATWCDCFRRCRPAVTPPPACHTLTPTATPTPTQTV